MSLVVEDMAAEEEVDLDMDEVKEEGLDMDQMKGGDLDMDEVEVEEAVLADVMDLAVMVVEVD